MARGRVITSHDDDFAPHRVSLETYRRSLGFPLSSLSLIDGFSRKSVSLSSDGSSFDVEVAKAATVDELKRAVEAVFSHLPQKGPGKISWPHVWGHFCLSFNGEKLVVDTAYIRDYGVKDGDQIHIYYCWYGSCRRDYTEKTVYGPNLAKSEASVHAACLSQLLHGHSHGSFTCRSQSQSTSCDDKEQNDNKDYKCDDKGEGKLHHYVDQGCFA